jgi:hypothetical protein
VTDLVGDPEGPRPTDAEGALQITCVRPSGRHEPHRRIRSIGGNQTNGESWTLLHHAAVAGVLEGRYRFVVERGSELVGVVVRRGKGGHEYLVAVGDELHPTTLLALDECS